MSDTLRQEIDTFNKLRPDLERQHLGKYALIRGSELIGTFDTFENAAREALRRYGNDSVYLIRQVGSEAPKLSPAIVYGLTSHVGIPYELQCESP